MIYEPGRSEHGLPHDPFKSCVVPRAIGWISTLSPDAVHNLAPFSQFTNVGFDPPTVMFSANQRTDGSKKDSVVNVEKTGEFVWNMATWDLRHEVNITAEEFAPDVDEFERAGLIKAASLRVRPARVAASPIHFECRHIQTLRLPGNGVMGTVDVVFGRVEVVHINDSVLNESGKIDILKLRPLARLGYYEYTSVESVFEMVISGSSELLVGLEGDAKRHSNIKNLV